MSVAPSEGGFEHALESAGPIACWIADFARYGIVGANELHPEYTNIPAAKKED